MSDAILRLGGGGWCLMNKLSPQSQSLYWINNPTATYSPFTCSVLLHFCVTIFVRSLSLSLLLASSWLPIFLFFSFCLFSVIHSRRLPLVSVQASDATLCPLMLVLMTNGRNSMFGCCWLLYMLFIFVYVQFVTENKIKVKGFLMNIRYICGMEMVEHRCCRF